MKNKNLLILSAILLCVGILLVVLGSGGEKGYSYEVQEETLENRRDGNNILIRYPLLSSENQDLSAANDQISKLLAQCLYDSYGAGITNLSLELNYEVGRQDKKWFSVMWEGSGSVSGTAHPNDHFFAVNLRVSDGARLKLIDIIRPEEGFIKILKERFVSQNERVAAIFESYTDEELLRMIAEVDQGGLGGFSYLTEKSIVISLPVAHAAGDHAETEIPLQSLKAYMRMELNES